MSAVASVAQAAPAEEPPEVRFDALRSAGIAALQRLCGSVWTDYNLHDPGVTTLEQLVYSLTDLAYRAGFDLADYLTQPDGGIDYARLALYAPEQILPCGALTPDDYRRLLYGCIPELGDVWLRADQDGLLHADVLPAADQPLAPGALAARVRAVYAAHRALCADLVDVREVTPRPYYLRGEIDTGGDRPPAQVLAQILSDCGDYLSSGLTARRLRDALADAVAPEDVFDGPRTTHGHVVARPGAALGASVTVSELIAVIQKVEGVRRIRALTIVDGQLAPCLAIPRDAVAGVYGVLPFPDDDATRALLHLQPEQGIEYGVSEQTVPAAPAWRAANRLLYEEGRLELAKLQFERRALRAEEGTADVRSALPQGRYRNLHAYYSVQHDFPAVYGVGRYGLPGSASDERRAQARQLQGYLYPMEQLMANFLQNLERFRTLFSLDDPHGPTYFSQYLDGPSVPGVADLYAHDPQDTAGRVRDALARHDDHAGRKGRAYDYLLALYGEAFPQTALRRFNHYHPHDTDAWLLDAKRRLLASIAALGAGRGRGGDYTQPLAAPGAVPPLAVRVAILVGFDGGDGDRSLLPAWDGDALPLVEEEDTDARDAAPADWMPVPPAVEPPRGAPAALDALRGALPETLFRDGALLANYRLAATAGGYTLHVQAGPRWHALGSYGRRADAVADAHAAVAALARMNRDCEGLHVVEHVLLRPRQEAEAEHAYGNPDFYGSRISVVLPRWTLRGADRSFRNFVEETVREHCPAHIHPTFLWLGATQMAWFETLHEDWRAALRGWHAAGDGDREERARVLHETAGSLVHFLRRHRKEPE